MQTIPIESDDHWHALRAKHIGSSEVAALFGRSPYATAYTLFHEKTGRLEASEREDNRMWLGKRLEPVIAERVSELMRWNLEARRLYCASDVVEGMGCTIDFHVVDHEDGPGIVEAKVVDYAIWASGWTEKKAPPHIELQLQHQLAVTGYAWGAIVPFILGYVNDVKIYERKASRKIADELAAAIGVFWSLVTDGIEPDPFGSPCEAEAIAALCSPPEPELVADLTGDEEAFELARQFAWAKEQEKSHAPIADAAKIKLLHRIGKAGRIVLPGFDLRRSKSGAIIKCERIEGFEPIFDAPASPLI